MEDEECPDCGENKLKDSKEYKGFQECKECGAVVCKDCGESDEDEEPNPCAICEKSVCIPCGGIYCSADSLEFALCEQHTDALRNWLTEQTKKNA